MRSVMSTEFVVSRHKSQKYTLGILNGNKCSQKTFVLSSTVSPSEKAEKPILRPNESSDSNGSYGIFAKSWECKLESGVAYFTLNIALGPDPPAVSNPLIGNCSTAETSMTLLSTGNVPNLWKASVNQSGPKVRSCSVQCGNFSPDQCPGRFCLQTWTKLSFSIRAHGGNFVSAPDSMRFGGCAGGGQSMAAPCRKASSFRLDSATHAASYSLISAVLLPTSPWPPSSAVCAV
mmetsp:Transcript_29825/g.65175  ORF Transcript_29825/g.65175 Transcript_29825/m.65175 type:complete len:233 (-) Transcript_29825:356-1054(-)